jgi:hypothetical protein
VRGGRRVERDEDVYCLTEEVLVMKTSAFCYSRSMLFIRLSAFFLFVMVVVQIMLGCKETPSARSVANAVTLEGNYQSPGMPENDSRFNCRRNEVMTGRQHYGDEKGETKYRCKAVMYNSTALELTDYSLSGNIKEDEGRWFVCGGNKVIVSREHDGDENGNTRYRCASASVPNSGAVLSVVYEGGDYFFEKESSHSFNCPANRAMVARYHKGDENGNTYYRCGYFQSP